ncbi:MAG: phosphodiester glycosidase family protein, partial [Candidatus Omnitrophota bacterium]
DLQGLIPELPQAVSRDEALYKAVKDALQANPAAFTVEETMYALDLFQGPSALEALSDNGIAAPRAVATAILFHHHIKELNTFLDTQDWPEAEKAETRLITSVLVTADTIENGINLFKKIYFRNTYVQEMPDQTLGWLNKSGIIEQSAIDAYKDLADANDAELAAIVAESAVISAQETEDLKRIGRSSQVQPQAPPAAPAVVAPVTVEVFPFTSERGPDTTMAVAVFEQGKVMAFPLFQGNMTRSWGMLRDKAPMHFKYQLEGQEVQDVDDGKPDKEHGRKDVWEIQKYLAEFQAAHPDMKVIGFVGNGNVMANGHLVAYVNGKLQAIEQEKALIHDAAAARRNYPSLIMWKAGNRFSIEEVQITSEDRIIQAATGKDITDEVAFVNSGVGILKNNEPYDLAEHYEHDSDVRHYLDFPFIPSLISPFGVGLFYDDNGNVIKDIMVPAINGEPVTLPLEIVRGTPLTEDQVRELENNLLTEKGYNKEKVPASVQEVTYGTYFINYADPINKTGATHITIGLQRGINPHNISAIDENGNLVSIVVAGKSNRVGITFKEAQDKLRELGIKDAVIFDNGADAMMNMNGEFVVPSFEGRDRYLSITVFAVPARPVQAAQPPAEAEAPAAPVVAGEPRVLYYPAAGYDGNTVLSVLRMNSGVDTVVLSDPYAYSGRDQVSGAEKTPEIIASQMFGRFVVPGSVTGTLAEGIRLSINYNDKVVNVVITSDDISKAASAEVRSLPTIHIVKLPGTSGLLSRSKEFYNNIILNNMKVGDRLYVSQAVQPVQYLAPEEAGLKLVAGERWIADPNAQLHMDISATKFGIFEKTRDITPEDMAAAIEKNEAAAKRYEAGAREGFMVGIPENAPQGTEDLIKSAITGTRVTVIRVESQVELAGRMSDRHNGIFIDDSMMSLVNTPEFNAALGDAVFFQENRNMLINLNSITISSKTRAELERIMDVIK